MWKRRHSHSNTVRLARSIDCSPASRCLSASARSGAASSAASGSLRASQAFALVELLRYSILAVHCLTQRSAALFAPRDNLRLARREIRRLQNYTAERISTRQRDDFGQCINVSAIAPKYES
jgi:hypothetical protein